MLVSIPVLMLDLLLQPPLPPLVPSPDLMVIQLLKEIVNFMKALWREAVPVILTQLVKFQAVIVLMRNFVTLDVVILMSAQTVLDITIVLPSLKLVVMQIQSHVQIQSVLTLVAEVLIHLFPTELHGPQVEVAVMDSLVGPIVKLEMLLP